MNSSIDIQQDPRFAFTNVSANTSSTDYDHYMLFSDDIDQFFSKIHLSNVTDPLFVQPFFNCTNFSNDTNFTTCLTDTSSEHHQLNYWGLVLLIVPILTLFGNVLVILSVYRERTLQTATNYFIVSLALADLLVAVVVMPFAVYVLVSTLKDCQTQI